ncbi:MAG: single-stranded DNA-binding protein [Ferruginibacter sp.]
MIKLQIVGNLGKDCIVNEVNGKKVINFSVAHTERYKDSQGNSQERTTWVECAYWTDRTAIADYLKKGKMVYAEGTPTADPYMNKENQAAANLRMRVLNIQLLGGNDVQGSNQGNVSNAGYNNNPVLKTESPSPSSTQAEPVASMEDDLPF